MRDGYKLKAWQPGGAGTGFLLPEHLDAQMYAGGIAKVGTRMGTGLAMAFASATPCNTRKSRSTCRHATVAVSS